MTTLPVRWGLAPGLPLPYGRYTTRFGRATACGSLQRKRRGMMRSVERYYLAADAGQPLSPAAATALSSAQGMAWADPRLRAHEGRSSASVLEAASRSLATACGQPLATVRWFPNRDLALSTTVEYFGVGAAVVSALDRQATLRAAGRRNADLGIDVEPVGVDDAGRPAWPTRLTGRGLDAQPVEAGPGPGRGEGPASGAVPGHRTGPTPGEDVPAARRGTEPQHGASSVTVVGQFGNPETGDCFDLPPRALLPAGSVLIADATAAGGRTALPESDWDVLVLDASAWAGGDCAVSMTKPGIPLLSRPGDLAIADLPKLSAARPWLAPPVADCAAAALAFEAAQAELPARSKRDCAHTDRLRTELTRVSGVQVHGGSQRLPHVVGFSALYIDAEALLLALDARGIAVSSGSACATDDGAHSHVLAALGALTSGNVRLTLPMTYPDAAIDTFLDVIGPAIDQLRTEAGV